MSNTTVKPRLLRLSYFYWLIVPLVIYFVIQIYGAPHFRWSYRYLDNGAYGARYYTECQYVGFGGVQVITPFNGQCKFLALLPGAKS
jgi:hypothetical protein